MPTARSTCFFRAWIVMEVTSSHQVYVVSWMMAELFFLVCRWPFDGPLSTIWRLHGDDNGEGEAEDVRASLRSATGSVKILDSGTIPSGQRADNAGNRWPSMMRWSRAENATKSCRSSSSVTVIYCQHRLALLAWLKHTMSMQKVLKRNFSLLSWI